MLRQEFAMEAINPNWTFFSVVVLDSVILSVIHLPTYNVFKVTKCWVLKCCCLPLCWGSLLYQEDPKVLNFSHLSLNPNLQQSCSSETPRTSSSKCLFQNFSVAELLPPADERSEKLTKEALRKGLFNSYFDINSIFYSTFDTVVGWDFIWGVEFLYQKMSTSDFCLLRVNWLDMLDRWLANQ